MTNSYRVFTRSEIQSVNGGFNSASGGMAITATKDGTNVQVQLRPTSPGSTRFWRTNDRASPARSRMTPTQT